LEIDRDCHEMHNDAIDIKVGKLSPFVLSFFLLSSFFFLVGERKRERAIKLFYRENGDSFNHTVKGEN
jgi:hypothetical protein